MQDDTKLTYAAFLRELRRALRHLYDPDELRRSPLLRLLPVSPHEGAASLQRVLTAAIEALKPDTGVAPQSNAWRTYHTLSGRYIQQFHQSEVARRFGLSLRQMRRQESLALRTLAEYLWTHYDLANRPALEPDGLSRQEELGWLERSLPSEPVALAELAEGVCATVSPLARALDVRLTCELAAGLPRPLARASALRQALLNLLTAAIRCVPGGEVTLGADTGAEGVSLRLAALGGASRPLTEDLGESVEMARELLAPSGATLEVMTQRSQRPFLARVLLPLSRQATVLVVDDNADALALCQRYLSGSRYAFVGARDPEQALALAESAAPRAIVLDVMLPGVDGWELLGRLREHPSTHGVPVIVCTILPQEQLALALGAAAFLRKPLTRASLLAALDQLPGLAPPGSP